MQHVRVTPPCDQWQQSPAALAIVATLAPRDVRLVIEHGPPGPDQYAWHPDSDHGAATFTALTQLRQQAIGPAFARANDDTARAAALAIAQRAPTVGTAVADRFGDPARWTGLGTMEATRRFRANWFE